MVSMYFLFLFGKNKKNQKSKKGKERMQTHLSFKTLRLPVGFGMLDILRPSSFGVSKAGNIWHSGGMVMS